MGSKLELSALNVGLGNKTGSWKKYERIFYSSNRICFKPFTVEIELCYLKVLI